MLAWIVILPTLIVVGLFGGKALFGRRPKAHTPPSDRPVRPPRASQWGPFPSDD